MRRWGAVAALVLWGLAFAGGGCATLPEQKPLGEWQGPSTQAPFTRAPWMFMGTEGEVLVSAHYRLYSTVESVLLREKILQLLEASYAEYQKLVPTAPVTDKLMEAYLFGTQGEWAEFTKQNTGMYSRLYLKMEGRGYAHEDFFVASFRGGKEWELWSVTGHEALHQYFSRHSKSRLAPVIEEGLACTFEVIRWEHRDVGHENLPRFNTKVNPERAKMLKFVLESRAMIPLEKLVTLHAGTVLGQGDVQIQAFYAEAWALARFLQEYDNGKYKDRLARWIADTVSGEMFDPTGTLLRASPRWDPDGVKPVMEHYLGSQMGILSKEFDEWCDYLAKEEIFRQWKSR